ncbi:DMT family transporter [Candidatus Dependentiae bacterium]|nr:DMT family transporter [Candidatus Dependentiae bacterium]
MFLIILLYALCASTFTISKWGLAYSEPLFFVALRMLLAGIILGAYCIIQREPSTLKDLWVNAKKDYLLFVQIVLFHIYLTYVCDLCALKNITSIESAFIYNLSPFIAALFSYLWFSEYMTQKKWFGLLLGFVSMVYGLINPSQTTEVFTHSGPRLIMLLAVISSSYGWIVVRALVKKGYSPVFINAFGMFVGGLLALVTSYATESWKPFPVTEWLPFLQALLLLVVIANIIFYNLYGYLLKSYTATFLSFAGFLCPLFVAIFGYFFLGESFSWHLSISFFFVFVGLIIFYHEELRQGYSNRSID